MKIISFDVGGSKISRAIVDENGKLLSDIGITPTPSSVEEIIRIFKKSAEVGGFDGFALATAGVVSNNRICGKPNNLPDGYQNINFADMFNVPVVIENDANAAAWAEFKIGALKNVQHGVMLTLGTDIGCGIICNSEILHGKCGGAGEVRFDCSGRSLQRLAAETGCNESDCFRLHNLALQQDGREREIYKIWQENLIECIRSINHILDTEVFALSGSLAAIVDYAAVNTMLKLIEPYNAPVVKAASCGTNAGLIGAALLCVEKLKG